MKAITNLLFFHVLKQTWNIRVNDVVFTTLNLAPSSLCAMMQVWRFNSCTLYSLIGSDFVSLLQKPKTGRERSWMWMKQCGRLHEQPKSNKNEYATLSVGTDKTFRMSSLPMEAINSIHLSIPFIHQPILSSICLAVITIYIAVQVTETKA